MYRKLIYHTQMLVLYLFSIVHKLHHTIQSTILLHLFLPYITTNNQLYKCNYAFTISYLGAASRLSFLEIVFGLRLQQGQLPSTR